MENQQTMKNPARFIDCNDVPYRNLILGRHRLFEFEYNEKIGLFFGAAIPEPKPHGNMAQLRAQLDASDCNRHKIKLGGEEENREDNMDITFHVDTDRKEFFVNYSVLLFKVVLDTYEPDEIYFSKAIHRNAAGHERYDIVFKAVREGEAVYYGDLTDLIP